MEFQKITIYKVEEARHGLEMKGTIEADGKRFYFAIPISKISLFNTKVDTTEYIVTKMALIIRQILRRKTGSIDQFNECAPLLDVFRKEVEKWEPKIRAQGIDNAGTLTVSVKKSEK